MICQLSRLSTQDTDFWKAGCDSVHAHQQLAVCHSTDLLLWCAEALIQAMMAASMEQQVFSLCSTEGEGPAQDASKWQALFDRCCRQQQAA